MGSGDAMLEGQRILVTGGSGNLGGEIVCSLAPSNTVYAAARFGRAGDRDYVMRAGAVPVVHRLGADLLSALPDDIDYVFNFGAILPGGANKAGSTVEASMEEAGRVNAQAAGEIMRRWPKLKGFVFASSSTVYQYQPKPLNERDAVGANFGTYSATKYAGEQVASFAAGLYGIPTLILRIFHSYGPRGGPVTDRIRMVADGRPVPVRSPGPNIACPLYSEDFVRIMLTALHQASVPPLVMNIGGDPVAQEDYVAMIGAQLGIEPVWAPNPAMNPSPQADTTLMRRIAGPPRISVEEGIRRAIAFNFPDGVRRR